MPFRLPAFYPILNVRDEGDAELARVRRLARELAEARVELIQLRAKPLGAGAMTELAAEMIGMLARHACKLVLNDRADVALAAHAAGVHVGDEDLPVAAARRVLGPDAIVGYSTHSVEEIRNAPADATYVAFGPVYDSPTKAGVREARGLEMLAAACRATTRPVVAIGGITLERAAEVWAAGASSCAVISEIERASSVIRLVNAWRAAARD